MTVHRNPVRHRWLPAHGSSPRAQPTWRLWAENSPFDLKDVPKARGYRWNGEDTGAPKAWFIDVADDAREAELASLKTEIYRGEIDRNHPVSTAPASLDL